MSRPALAVDADLTAVCDDGRSISLAGNGSTLVVTVDAPGTLGMLRAGRSRRLQERLGPGLRETDLTIEVRVAERLVAVASPGRRASWLARLLGFAPFRLRPAALLAAWWQR